RPRRRPPDPLTPLPAARYSPPRLRGDRLWAGGRASVSPGVAAGRGSEPPPHRPPPRYPRRPRPPPAPARAALASPLGGGGLAEAVAVGLVVPAPRLVEADERGGRPLHEHVVRPEALPRLVVGAQVEPLGLGLPPAPGQEPGEGVRRADPGAVARLVR